MIEQIKTYVVSCDGWVRDDDAGCWDECETNVHIQATDKNDLYRHLRKHGWTVWADSRITCPIGCKP